MQKAYDATRSDCWLHRMSEYRSLFLHRQAMGRLETASLRYEERSHHEFTIPVITMPLVADARFAPGADAPLRFIGLHRR